MFTTTTPASTARLHAATRAFESAGAMTMASARCASICSTRLAWAFTSSSSLMPLAMSS